MRCRRNEILGSHSLHLMTKNQYAVQKKSNREKAQSLIDDENQLRGAEEISFAKPVKTISAKVLF